VTKIQNKTTVIDTEINASVTWASFIIFVGKTFDNVIFQEI